MYSFFAYMARMPLIRRWSLMRSTREENIAEHTTQVAMLAHALALIRNRLFGGTLDADRVAVAALYHEASEVMTGDLPTPIKYYNPEIRSAYGEIEKVAEDKLLSLLPPELREEYRPLLGTPEDADVRRIVKAADKIAAYVKCLEETKAGNREFSRAETSLRKAVDAFRDLPEVDYFCETFLDTFRKTLDELE